MKYLCLDYGSKRIGIAVSNTEGTIAFPRTTLDNSEHFLKELGTLIEQEKIDVIVVGDTRTLGGVANTITLDADALFDSITERFGVPVERVTEAFSSGAVAAHAPRGKKHDDAAAAAFILQRYLDMKGKRVE